MTCTDRWRAVRDDHLSGRRPWDPNRRHRADRLRRRVTAVALALAVGSAACSGDEAGLDLSSDATVEPTVAAVTQSGPAPPTTPNPTSMAAAVPAPGDSDRHGSSSTQRATTSTIRAWMARPPEAKAATNLQSVPMRHESSCWYSDPDGGPGICGDAFYGPGHRCGAQLQVDPHDRVTVTWATDDRPARVSANVRSFHEAPEGSAAVQGSPSNPVGIEVRLAPGHHYHLSVGSGWGATSSDEPGYNGSASWCVELHVRGERAGATSTTTSPASTTTTTTSPMAPPLP